MSVGYQTRTRSALMVGNIESDLRKRVFFDKHYKHSIADSFYLTSPIHETVTLCSTYIGVGNCTVRVLLFYYVDPMGYLYPFEGETALRHHSRITFNLAI